MVGFGWRFASFRQEPMVGLQKRCRQLGLDPHWFIAQYCMFRALKKSRSVWGLSFVAKNGEDRRGANSVRLIAGHSSSWLEGLTIGRFGLLFAGALLLEMPVFLVARWLLSHEARQDVGADILVQFPGALAAALGVPFGLLTAGLAFRDYRSKEVDRAVSLFEAAREATWDQREYRAAWRSLVRLVAEGSVPARDVVQFCLKVIEDHLNDFRPSPDTDLFVSSEDRANEAANQLARILGAYGMSERLDSTEMRNSLSVSAPDAASGASLDLGAVVVGRGTLDVAIRGGLRAVILPKTVGREGVMIIQVGGVRDLTLPAVTVMGNVELHIESGFDLDEGSSVTLARWVIEGGGRLEIHCEAPNSSIRLLGCQIEGKIDFAGGERWENVELRIEHARYSGEAKIELKQRELVRARMQVVNCSDDSPGAAPRVTWSKVTVSRGSVFEVEDAICQSKDLDGEPLSLVLPEVTNDGGSLRFTYCICQRVQDVNLELSSWSLYRGQSRLLLRGGPRRVEISQDEDFEPQLTIDVRRLVLYGDWELHAARFAAQLLSDEMQSSLNGVLSVRSKRWVEGPIPSGLTVSFQPERVNSL